MVEATRWQGQTPAEVWVAKEVKVPNFTVRNWIQSIILYKKHYETTMSHNSVEGTTWRRTIACHWTTRNQWRDENSFGIRRKILSGFLIVMVLYRLSVISWLILVSNHTFMVVMTHAIPYKRRGQTCQLYTIQKPYLPHRKYESYLEPRHFVMGKKTFNYSIYINY